ncbi:hypothetical protein OH460_07875 [Vibrio sp. Makdt]|uniref:hypothetical protein n=1 Tax=Vibrio sp. Makdt TaxID=2998828 RepID=UPI0022CD586F|nr:hypothetical protein [Vibrio sp. Makdt]MDA0152215.1 hypothetical protein [Vibrio sp. Makdt]
MFNITDKYLKATIALTVSVFVIALPTGIATNDLAISVVCMLLVALSAITGVTITMLLLISAVFSCDPEVETK